MAIRIRLQNQKYHNNSGFTAVWHHVWLHLHHNSQNFKKTASHWYCNQTGRQFITMAINRMNPQDPSVRPQPDWFGVHSTMKRSTGFLPHHGKNSNSLSPRDSGQPLSHLNQDCRLARPVAPEPDMCYKNFHNRLDPKGFLSLVR